MAATGGAYRVDRATLLKGLAMNEEFNIHAARRLESIRLSTLLEASAVQRETDLNALLRAAAAHGGAMSGGLLKQEVEIIFAATGAMVDTVIAYRKELAARAPDLLLAHPYLKEFHTKLDQLADGAVISVQQRHATKAPAGQFPAATLNAVLGLATRRASVLKNKINNEIRAMALEGELGMHRKNQSQHITNMFHGPVGNVAQNSEHFTQAAAVGIQPHDLTRLVKELIAHLDELNLDVRQKQRAEAQIATLKAELAGDPDPAVVKQAARTLRNITEGAVGSLLATAAQPGIWHWIHQALAGFAAT
jgi:hypothetical protein